jgi:hypothetical protein
MESFRWISIAGFKAALMWMLTIGHLTSRLSRPSVLNDYESAVHLDRILSNGARKAM